MKYNEFYAELTAKGCYVQRHGSNHDIWINPVTGNTCAVGRHGSKEVSTAMVRKVRRLLGV
jgi:predicted RNA binding protein YcfA (HicA-like mRNA interferase family)